MSTEEQAPSEQTPDDPYYRGDTGILGHESPAPAPPPWLVQAAEESSSTALPESPLDLASDAEPQSDPHPSPPAAPLSDWTSPIPADADVDAEPEPDHGLTPLAAPLSDWMSRVSGNVNIRDMSIPGTHESCAYQEEVWSAGYALCQSRDVAWQLNNGVRYLDVRIRRISGGVFSVHHGDYYLKQMFGDVLVSCANFLRSHRSETVLMRVSQTKSNASSGDFQGTFNFYLDNNSWRRWFHINSAFPTLDQARGKIVLMSGWPYLGYGLHFSSTDKFDIQDEYSHVSPIYKRQAIGNHLAKAINAGSPKQKVFVNHSSATGTKTPWSYASEMNPYTLSELTNRYAAGRTVGVIAMDYIDRPHGSTSGGKTDLMSAVVRLNPLVNTPTGTRVLTMPAQQGSAVTGPAYQGIQGQSFSIARTYPDVLYSIRNKYSGLALTMGANGVVTGQSYDLRHDQLFSLVSQSDGSTGIRSHHNLVLDMSNTGVVTGRQYAGNVNQSFHLVSQSDGSTGIRSMYHWVGPSREVVGVSTEVSE